MEFDGIAQMTQLLTGQAGAQNAGCKITVGTGPVAPLPAGAIIPGAKAELLQKCMVVLGTRWSIRVTTVAEDAAQTGSRITFTDSQDSIVSYWIGLDANGDYTLVLLTPAA